MTRISLTVLSLTLFASAALSASQHGSPAEGIATASLLRDLQDGELDQHTLFEAALIAGGVDSPAELQRHTADFHRLAGSLSDELHVDSGTPAQLDFLLRRLHERLLTGEYRSEVTEVHRTLECGDYNCVTATILFQSLCNHCGLSVRVVAAESHVLCYAPGTPPLFAEATCKGCRTMTIEDCPPSLQRLLRQSRELTATQLLGKIYYNLGVAKLKVAEFADAAELLEIAVRVDSLDTAARENLLATYNNWSLDECDRGRFSTAQKLLLHGLAIDSHHEPLLANDLYVHQRWVRDLCNAGQFWTAFQLLDQGYRRRPGVRLFAEGRVAVLDWWAESQFVRGDLAAGWEILAAGQQRFGESPNASREIALVQESCDELQRRQQVSTALELLDQAIGRYPQASDLRRAKANLLEAGL